jgi:regulator of ribonuclease activity A
MTASDATSDLCDVHRGDISENFRVLPPVFRSLGAVHSSSRRVVTGKCCEGNWLV